MAQTATALQTWLLENNVAESEQEYDDAALAQHKKLVSSSPWKSDPNYFKHVRISAVALIKMVMHARSGGSLEVMGLMQGKVLPNTMVVMDAFALPVEGTETRVNAQQEAYEYMVQYQQTSSETGRQEHIVGWYHSHPGYGCWLSGIDVSTQMTNQQFTEPFLAVVIDPNRTISSGKVEIGAFRTYPAGYVPPHVAPSEYQSIPLSKIEDFGVHANQYYQLDVSIFKSLLDKQLLELLWNRYWVNTLSTSSILMRIFDLADKIDQAENQLSTRAAPRPSASRSASGPPSERSANRSGGGGKGSANDGGDDKGDEDSKTESESTLAKSRRDGVKIGCEQLQGMMSEILKQMAFRV
ncbi:hypothetical protein RI367_008358 [Sorochytrium milnesiophthora]